MSSRLLRRPGRPRRRRRDHDPIGWMLRGPPLLGREDSRL